MGVLARAGGALKSLAALPFRVVLSSKLWALMLAANYLAYHQSAALLGRVLPWPDSRVCNR